MMTTAMKEGCSFLSSDKFDADDHVTFSLNGKTQRVSGLPGETTLLKYIRDVAQLKGTKYMCREGGCGSCIVTLTFTDPVSGLERSLGINSCLYAVYLCQGMSVTTVEGIGSKEKGYHPVQTRLAHFNGSQCGFCSPGWVMAMYSLLKSNRALSMKQIEDSFGSNNCRCTGYRPILDAFKSFADDTPQDLQNKVADIEDLLRSCSKSANQCNRKCKLQISNSEDKIDDDDDADDGLERHFVEVALSAESVSVPTGGHGRWYRVSSLQVIFELFTMIQGSYMLVGGNTAQGVYEEKYPPPPDFYIDINGVLELKRHGFDGDTLVLGANKTLTDTMDLFRAVAVERPATHRYLEALADHINKVAHIPVRNIGTLAGNLSTKHSIPRFPSDLFTIFETVGAQLVLDFGNGSKRAVSLPEYLESNVNKSVTTQILFKPLDPSFVVKTFKVQRRAQNDHAVVNAGFCFSFDKRDGYRVLKRPSIVYGGIRPDFIHASKTESFLVGKRLLNSKTLQKALSLLNAEVVPDRVLPEASKEYRKGLALSLFYRYVLSLTPSAVHPKFRSGGDEIARPLSSGKQIIYSDPEEYPLTQPIPKIESLIQCSGEIQYTNDMIYSKTELFASLVLAGNGPATLVGLDPKPALRIPGVVAFFSAKDIPGTNSYVTVYPPFKIFEPEVLFADGEILYAGQPVGVLVATSQELADFAAVRVDIKYKDIRKPLLSVQDVLKVGDRKRLVLQGTIDPTAKKKNVVYKVEGNFSYKGQYHYYYETQTCAVELKDNNNLNIVVSSQWMNGMQEAISNLLNISENRINIQVKRCGGSYGGKIARSSQISCVCALAAYLLQRPVRAVLNLETNMRALGGRYPMYIDYEAGVNNEGTIQYLKAEHYTDQGVTLNESLTKQRTLLAFPNIYDSSTWRVAFFDVKTDKASSTQTRAPGRLGAVGAIEHIMEHIAWTVKKDPWTVRMNNIATDSPIPEYGADLKTKADFDSRLQDCRAFNAANQWKKRGISMVPVKYNIGFVGTFHAFLSVYRLDGTVAISLGAIEVGQGVNTKVAQVAAHVLGIDLDFIQVKAANNLTSPNDIYTAASTSSDGVCFAVRKCCEQINERLAPVRESLGSDVTWPAVVNAAFLEYIDLSATYMFVPDEDLKDYTVYGLTVLDIEIDCLTGEHRVVRVDILQNIGKSISPLVDVGQIEGAFLMGIGHFTSEELIFDPVTGRLTTDRTWEYKVPGAKDIPVDWRIYFKKDPDSPPVGTYGSKSVAEAPLVLSVSVLFAIRRALESVRRDIGLPNTFFNNDSPCTTENIFLRSKISFDEYDL